MKSPRRQLNRSLDRRLTRRVTRGHTSVARDFNDAMIAFARVVRARLRLMELAPERFDEAVKRARAAERATESERCREIAAAIAKVYQCDAHETYASLMRRFDDDHTPRRPARTERAIERWQAERALWLKLADQAFARVEARPHLWLSLSQIARLLDLASQLGRCATGLPLRHQCRKVKPAAEPESGSRISFEEAVARAFGPDGDSVRCATA